MALGDNELFTSNTDAAKLRVSPKSVQPKTFAVGAVTILPGTPVAFDTVANTWQVFEQGGANEIDIIRGFVWPDKIVLDAADEVLGQVMLSGRIHRDDVVLPAGELQADVDAAMKAGLRENTGIIVEGLEGFH